MGSEVLTPEGFKLYFHKAENKQHPETVVFVHHMWGNHGTTRRHYQYLNQLGYDCVSFDLLFGSDKKTLQTTPLLKYAYKGVFYLWTRQIRATLNFIDGDKIVFAFSGPSLSALWACHDRSDIRKVICDGGPFLQIFSNTKNFFYYILGVKQPQLNAVGALFGTSIWGYKPLNKLHKILKKWPSDIPILSIRGVEDNIVAIQSIRDIFSPHPNIKLSVLELEKGKHLDGIKLFPQAYKKALSNFLP